MSDIRTVGVRLLDLPYHLDTEYTYSIPQDLDGTPSVGGFVFVPFGRGNTRKAALIVSQNPPSDYAMLKPILGYMNPELTLSPSLMALVGFITERTLCSAGDAVRRIIPPEAFTRFFETYYCDALPTEEYNRKAMDLLLYLRKHPGASDEAVEKAFNAQTVGLARLLAKKGVVRIEKETRDAAPATVSYITPAGDVTKEAEDALRSPRTPQAQRDLYAVISESDGMEQGELIALGFTSAQIKALEKKRLIHIEKTEVTRNPYGEIVSVPRRDPVLSEEQTHAKAKLLALCLDGKPHGALLFGVTGSGKTSVILSLCRSLAEDGKTAIVLVPEIALTWQSVSAFAAVFGNRLAVIHSRLSGGERLDTYRRIRKGEVDVVLGTRSAVFAPVRSLGAIIIDEEQEHTYKSDQSPKYHARDIARFRCAEAGALMLLCSATPSVESFEKARSGVYTLVELKKRYGAAVLPRVIISDMRKNASDPTLVIGDQLKYEISRNLSAGEQTVLFLNRRGYNSFVTCRVCGEAVRCPHCSVSLTYHKRRDREKGQLVCHYCGYRTEAPVLCPSCGSEHLAFSGYGTQKVEADLAALFPTARILRMDADTTKARFSQDEICEQFKNREADILIGTQMVTKGHNFPGVTLVGVVAADHSLFMDDFRAAERTFSLITQVVGRAGRGASPGRAVIQTYAPEDPTIVLAARQDYVSFYENEIKLRRAYSFPPFCDLVTVGFTGYGERSTGALARRFADRLHELSAEYADCPMSVFGPFEASVYKISEKYRLRLVIKCRNTKRQRALFATLMKEFAKTTPPELSITLDIGPTVLT